MEPKLDPALKDTVRLLGDLLSDVIEQDQGAEFVSTIVKIRTLAKEARANPNLDNTALIQALHSLADQDITPITRAFNQFLNLANIAEQYHDVVRGRRQQEKGYLSQLDDVLETLKQELPPGDLTAKLSQLNIELVLTAHPTEVTRRTLIQKYENIFNALNQLDQAPFEYEREWILEGLKRVIAQIWYTDEIRQQRPTPQDEARWGYAVIEGSLWQAIPRFYRDVDQLLAKKGLAPLPMDATPIRFHSWMGGDRDGNPNVTATVTGEVILLGRWMAMDLYLRDLDILVNSLSMERCNETLKAVVGDTKEPYRHLIHELRQRIRETQKQVEEQIKFPQLPRTPYPVHHISSLLEPLLLCYDSLMECGMSVVAQGKLLDTIRCAYTFGLNLCPLDIRQESGRHAQVFSELTQYLDLGDYLDWSEEERQRFLVKELQNKRPLLPRQWQPSPEVQEVLDTCRVIANESPDCFANYVISMAGHPSDVLAVALLLKMSDCPFDLPIAPLFETLDDLTRAADSIEHLLNIPWYKKYNRARQMVMVGYSDSAKDAGQLAACWAQYKAQEELTNICDRYDTQLMLFHGRGGTVGRGGGPAHSAILSQPPGSVRGNIRVTEQGEMIRFKFGHPEVAQRSLQMYLSAVLQATELPPPHPKESWRQNMETLANVAVTHYRKVVRETDEFVPYFRAVTPEQELGKLALGSRPAKRKASGGVESLRAIPWIFAWTQIRLMLPAWLGSETALQNFINEQGLEPLREMSREWPFFETYMDMLEMVLSKADLGISRYYEETLCGQSPHALGETLRQKLTQAISLVNNVKHQAQLLDHSPTLRHSMAVRNPYTDPLHYLQAELLLRTRQNPEQQSMDHALKVTMAGIAAGMRNTG